jgi:hypothetical protein
MAQEFEIEQEYGRFIPPVVDKAVKKAKEDRLLELEADMVIETEDGGAIVDLGDIEDDIPSEFYDNLAEYMEEDKLKSLADGLLEYIEKDKQAREKRDKQYEEGIKRTGLGNDAPGGADFSGASRVVHPIMAEACVDFAARAIKELFPPTGPVRTKIVGKVTRGKLEKAERKREYMNWQLTSQIKNYRAELEQLLTQLPLGGGQFLKFWYDSRAGRPDCEFVPIDEIYLPYASTNFYTSPRVTHVQDITRFEFDKRVRLGLYRDIDVLAPTLEPEETKAQEASNKVEGKDATAYNEDGLRRVYEIYVYESIDDDDISGGDVAPYIITVDEDKATVLSIYRNWAEDDETFEKLDWLVEFQFIPWRGAYPIGLPQLIGGLSAALTGALRALLDTAHINNSPSLLKLKGTSRGMSGQSRQVDPTELSEIDGPPGVDDIRKMIMAMPFNPPSTVLFQLLDWLTNQAKGVVATAEEKIADANNNMPVGTALALIEQGSITYSAIHSRLHHAQAKCLEILSRLNAQYLSEEQEIEELGELIIKRSDFEGGMDIIPVSDPNIFSEAQRYAQVQAILQLETVSPPGMFNQYNVRHRALSLMHVDDIDDLLPPPPTPTQLNAVAENVAASYGQPLAAFPEQDHLAHIETHLRFLTDPNTGGNPLLSSTVMPIMDHLKQHIIMFYSEAVQNALSAGDAQPGSIREEDNAIAAAAALADGALGEVFAPLSQLFQQALTVMQEQQKSQQAAALQDPSAQAMLQASLAETERKSKDDQTKAQLAQKKQQDEAALELQKQQGEMRVKMDKQQRDSDAKIADLQGRMQDLRVRAAEAAARADAETERLEIQREQQELSHLIQVAQLEQRELELERKAWEFEQKQVLEYARIESQEQQAEENRRAAAQRPQPSKSE